MKKKVNTTPMSSKGSIRKYRNKFNGDIVYSNDESKMIDNVKYIMVFLNPENRNKFNWMRVDSLEKAK